MNTKETMMWDLNAKNAKTDQTVVKADWGKSESLPLVEDRK
jgi:hypothetical protein